MSERKLPEIKHYGPTLDTWASEFTLANESVNEDATRAQIDQALDKLYVLRDKVNQASNNQTLGELEELHSFIRLQRQEHEVLTHVLEELIKSGTKVPDEYETEEVVALSRDSDWYDNVASWLVDLPIDNPQLKAAAIRYELDHTTQGQEFQWLEIDDVLIEANTLVGKIEAAIGELEQIQAKMDAKDYPYESAWMGDYDDPEVENEDEENETDEDI